MIPIELTKKVADFCGIKNYNVIHDYNGGTNIDAISFKYGDIGIDTTDNEHYNISFLSLIHNIEDYSGERLSEEIKSTYICEYVYYIDGMNIDKLTDCEDICIKDALKGWGDKIKKTKSLLSKYRHYDKITGEIWENINIVIRENKNS